MTIDPNRYYAVQGEDLQRIERVMKRLYSEDRFRNGDEMRDHAQLIQVALDHAEPMVMPYQVKGG